jgi:hypothetical protein
MTNSLRDANLPSGFGLDRGPSSRKFSRRSPERLDRVHGPRGELDGPTL